MTRPAPAANWRQSLHLAVNEVNLQVNPDNVLQVRKVLLQEADRLLNHVRRTTMDTQFVGLCGGDPVSQQASIAFNQRIGLLIEQCRNYGNSLWKAGDALGTVAKGYGYSDEQIQESFKSLSPETRA